MGQTDKKINAYCISEYIITINQITFKIKITNENLLTKNKNKCYASILFLISFQTYNFIISLKEVCSKKEFN